VKAASKVVLFFCLAIVFLPFQSEASSPGKEKVTKERWEYYASDEEGSDYSYNPDAIGHRKGNRVRVWVRATYSDKNPAFTEGKFQWEVDCVKKRLRGISAEVKKKDGTLAVPAKSSNWSDIPSGSTAETLYDTVCKKKDKKAP
jgi:hypothetical protein